MMLTNNAILIHAAQKHYDKFKVPTSFVCAQKTERFYENRHKADLDIRTSVNKIGEIVNLSQQLNNLMWDNINRKHQSFDQNKELYFDICKLAVLSNIEIDKAKKEFALNSGIEIGKLKEKWKIKQDDKTVKPMFFKGITRGNGYRLSPHVHYMWFKTSMDFLNKRLGSFKFAHRKCWKRSLIEGSVKYMPLYDLFDKDWNHSTKGTQYARAKSVIDIMKEYRAQMTKLKQEFSYAIQHSASPDSAKDYKTAYTNTRDMLFKEMIQATHKVTLSSDVIRVLVMCYMKNRYPDITKDLFYWLFSCYNENVYQVLISKISMLTFIKETEDEACDVRFFGLKFKYV